MADHDPSDVIDRNSGKVRVLSARCATCIFWADDRMHLGQDRIEEVVAANIAADALLTCHSTLPYGWRPDFGPAVCAGFWAKHRHQTAAGRLAERALGVVRVQPPSDEEA
jgi:hypothetical protein